MTALALGLYAPLLLAGVVLVWRRPVLALYVFVIGLALHNTVMALLYGAGVRGAALTTIQGWKEVLLATALASVVWSAWRARRLPFQPGPVDGIALAFAAVVVVYLLVPQDALGGSADFEDALYGARHALLPVGAYLLGRSLSLGRADLSRLGWTILGAAALLAAIGLLEEYTISVERWRDAGVPAYFRDQLGFDYHGPGGMPENFAFNSEDGLFRRLVSLFISPLATAFMLLVALLLAAAGGPLRRPVALPLAAVCAAGFLFTLTRSAVVALAAGLVVLAVALGRTWPLAATAGTVAAGVTFALVFTSVAPRTHFFPEELEYQKRQARLKGDLPGGNGTLSLEEPSLRSHLSSLRDGVETVLGHPQGYGLGNAGAIARRNDVELKAGESNYTELGVEVGLAGALLFVAWNLALVLGLLRAARSGGDLTLQWARASLAASLAAVLVLGLQTDAFGVPWLAYCVWSLGGAFLTQAAVPARARSSVRAPGVEGA